MNAKTSGWYVVTRREKGKDHVMYLRGYDKGFVEWTDKKNMAVTFQYRQEARYQCNLVRKFNRQFKQTHVEIEVDKVE